MRKFLLRHPLVTTLAIIALGVSVYVWQIRDCMDEGGTWIGGLSRGANCAEAADWKATQ